MKKFWLVLLSLGLVMAFSASAFAVDVKVSGEYYAAGLYLDKTNVMDDDSANSTAFFYQRLRVGTDFIVSPSLKLVTRFDAMERIWGGARDESAASAAAGYDTQSAGTKMENQNIAFDLLYAQYDSPIGTFKVGYQIDAAWGTIFMDSSMPRGTVAWSYTSGPWFYYLGYKKFDDKSLSAVTTTTTQTDLDRDKSALAIKYIGKSAEGGLLGGHVRDARSKTPGNNATTLFYYLQPYAKATFGPVKIQAEIDYFWGDMPKDAATSTDNRKLELIAGWIDATVNLGTFYAGGTVAYVSGDDPDTKDKTEGQPLVVNGGQDWNPCLIMFNNDVAYWVGNVYGNAYGSTNTNLSGPMANALFFQGRAGLRPTPQWDVMLSLSFAQADKKPAGVANGTYGTEVDLTGTYKITNNLSYMLGAGYLFTGDYFKGDESLKGNTHKVDNDYMLINKLTLSF
ncbi:MAG: membrane protein [Smithella sp.]|jgi:hypothetical protein